MNIAIDMMGGDFAPLETAIGIAQYFKQPENIARLLLLGNEPDILPLVELYQIPPDRITIIHTPEVIGYHDHPVKALKEKQQSSIAKGFRENILPTSIAPVLPALIKASAFP